MNMMELELEKCKQPDLLVPDPEAMQGTVLQCNKYMFQSKLGCDVCFYLGSQGQEVKAHKYILISRSPVFFSMFYGPMADNSKMILVPDINPEIFEKFLRYLYTDDRSVVDSDSVMHLLYAAKKYSTFRLEERCKEFLSDNINTDNACLILEQSHDFDEENLYEECLKFILKNAKDIFENGTIIDLSEKCLQDIIESDYLMSEEKDIYEAVLHWSEFQCKKKNMEVNDENLREILGPALYLIRFPLLKLSYFANTVSKRQILSLEEKLFLYEYLCRSEVAFNTNVIPFITQYRKMRPWTVCDRFKKMVTNNDWVQKGKSDAISFSCSVPILLHGINLYHGGQKRPLYDADVQLQDAKENVLAKMQHDEESNEYPWTTSTFPVIFYQPVKLVPGHMYTIVVRVIGPRSFYGERGRKKVTCENVTFEFSSHPDKSHNSTNVFTGQIPSIIFSPWL